MTIHFNNWYSHSQSSEACLAVRQVDDCSKFLAEKVFASEQWDIIRGWDDIGSNEAGGLDVKTAW